MKSVKTVETEKLPKSNDKKRKNQTSLLQFSKKREVKEKVVDVSQDPASLGSEKENFVHSSKPVSSFFSSAKIHSPAKELPNDAEISSEHMENTSETGEAGITAAND